MTGHSDVLIVISFQDSQFGSQKGSPGRAHKHWAMTLRSITLLEMMV